MSKLVTFGEIMLRISPENGCRLFQSDRARTCFGGSEANVAALCAHIGLPSSFVTALPHGPLGDAAVAHLRSFGVDTSQIVRGDGRLGAYYYEKGAGARPAQCVYDRAGSAFALSTAQDYDDAAIFDGADAFHLSGITPALSAAMPDVCAALVKAAKERGLFVSFDLNHRARLWSAERCREAVERLLPCVDLFISNVHQANDVFALGADTDDGQSACAAVARAIAERYGKKTVALTVRKTISADVNRFSAALFDGDEAHFSPEYETSIVDRVGSGDAFDGALLAALLGGRGKRYAIGYATAAAVLKHSIEGDAARLTDAEIRSLAEGRDARTLR